MQKFLRLCALAIATVPALAASKTHVISFGNWQLVKAEQGADAEPVALRVRALLVDGKVKEYTLGPPHDVTERLFVVARVFRLNDALPEEKSSKWVWQRGGWVQVDRSSGRIAALKLPNFDSELSVASWYRDYIAYCGISEGDALIYAMVMQVGVHKPILRKALEGTKSTWPHPLCRPPMWQRKPMRVEFDFEKGPNLTITIREHSLGITTADEDDTE